MTSLSMHWLQYQHRQRLRRRVASGQVDLEALGIKRLSVPRKILDAFPIRVYVPEPTTPVPADEPITPVYPEQAFSQKSPIRHFAAPDPPLPPTPLPTSRRPSQYRHLDTTLRRGYSQTQCPICLDDFTPYDTVVRELPCLHVFHPDCIDPFLETQSSLCPLCKSSALPQGYVPPALTNATVRRERNLRRMRARVDAGGDRGRWWTRIIPTYNSAYEVHHMHAHSAAYPALPVSGMSESPRRVPHRSALTRDMVMRGRRIMTQEDGATAEADGRPKCRSSGDDCWGVDGCKWICGSFETTNTPIRHWEFS